MIETLDDQTIADVQRVLSRVDPVGRRWRGGGAALVGGLAIAAERLSGARKQMTPS